jgi:hypothetical protein
MADKSKQLLSILLDSLLKQFKSKKPDLMVIAGALQGLSSFLVNFSDDLKGGT